MSYIGQTLPADSFQGFTTDSFTGDGSATTFTLSKTPFNESALLVVINNVIQKPTTNFTVSGTTLTIVGTAVADGDVIYAIHMGGPLPIGEANRLDLNGASDQLILDADADTTISADTDDQIDFKAGGTDVMSMTATGLTINDGTTITTADNTDTLTLTSTDADASVGPALRLYRNSASPADDDELAKVRFDGKNSAGEDVTYGYIQVQPADVTDGTEDGFMQLQTMVGGTSRGRISMYSYATVMNEHSQDIDFRVETDGNANGLLVDAGNNMVTIGKNTDDGGTVGHFFGTVGSVNHVRDDNNVMALVRKSGDGNICQFYKDSTVAGYIGTGNSGDLYIGNDDTGLMFAGGSNAIIPTNLTSLIDDTIILGHSSYRFNAIYAATGSVNSSDRNEKQDEASLTATETKVAVAVKGLLKKYRWKNAFAKKGDDARIHFGIIAQDLQDAFTAEGLDASRYAMFCSDTWWEKEISVPAKVADKEKGIDAEDAYTYKDHKDEETEGYTKRTRLGVRYDQVLAFIIAGI